MNRKELVKARASELLKLNDRELVQTVAAYFAENQTMPGEKALKDRTADLLAAFEQNPSDNILAKDFREELIETFASLCVKEVRVKGVRAKNETKKNEKLNTLKASELPMVRTDSHFIPVNTMKDTYEMSATIEDNNGNSNVIKVNGETADGEVTFALGYLPKGFVKNHRAIEGMTGTVIADDYSNGKFRNMSYKFLVDLAQNLAV